MINWKYDSKDYVEGGNFAPVPVGYHKVRIEKAEETMSKSGKDMIKLEMSVSGQTGKLWYYLVFPNEQDAKYQEAKRITNQHLGDIWESFDMTPGDMNLLNWKGKIGAVYVKHEYNENKGEMQAQVGYFLTQKKQDDLQLPTWNEHAGTPAAVAAPESLRNESGDEAWKHW